ncbi:unnamed protein product [Musa acuminata subsp. malaccensis]|uniref:(wild Malaysian banana) hypothetical protein n=1 Tax=Musa acuminata subsp. malaccensis TaxID=214687 RepID=A0A804KNI3_MUSAM|nr:unnamed protein product [Musa acuminata subsp. malaccensis]
MLISTSFSSPPSRRHQLLQLLQEVRDHPSLGLLDLDLLGPLPPDPEVGRLRSLQGDFHRFSISKELVMAAGGSSGNSSDWLVSRVGFETETGSRFPMEGMGVRREARKEVAGSFWREEMEGGGGHLEERRVREAPCNWKWR